MKISELVAALIDLVAPRACAECGSRLAKGEELLCARCLLHLPRTRYSATPRDNAMAQRFWGLVEADRAAAWFYYEPKAESSQVIRRMKYNNHPEYGELLGRMAAGEFGPDHFFDGIDALVPVPLTKARRRERGYNQSVEIARGISDVTGIPVMANVLTRKHFTKSQTAMTRAERQDNVADAFELSPKADIAGKHLLLIDDVVTTGATMRACATQLLSATDVTVSMMSLACTRV